MDISVLKTDDPQTIQFSLSGKISEREKTYGDAQAALISPVAHKIFGFPWAQTVKVGPDFVAITKQEWVDWDVLEEPLKGLLNEHFKTYGAEQTVEENPEPKAPENKNLESPEAQAIQQLFENEVNPSLASHGGFVTLHGIKENKAYIEMGGGCQGCAMSYMTLKEGIETAVKERVPSIVEVVDVTDHAMGSNPFYS